LRVKFHTQESDWSDISAHCGEGHQAPPEALQKGPGLDRAHLTVLKYYDLFLILTASMLDIQYIIRRSRRKTFECQVVGADSVFRGPKVSFSVFHRKFSFVKYKTIESRGHFGK
jgi:hypothetical protein